MTVVTNEMRAKYVTSAIIDRVTSSFSLSSLFTDRGSDIKGGESIDIGTFTDGLSVQDGSDTAGASVAVTIETASPTANNLKVDKHKVVFVDVPKIQSIFDLEGSWPSEIAKHIMTKLAKYQDQDLYDDLVLNASYVTGSTATYMVNPEGDALTKTDINLAFAKMNDQDGIDMNDLVWVFSAYGAGSLRNISEFQPDPGFLGSEELGLRRIGYLNGVPVVISNQVRQQRVVAATATAISSNVCTAVVAEGHGLQPGQLVTLTGASANVASAAITSTTATTVVFPLTAANNATNGAGTLTVNMSYNSLMHRAWCFKAMTRVPSIRIVPRPDRDSDVLQASAVWGKKSLPGAAIIVGSPRNAI